MNYNDIKSEIADNWEQFESNQYPDDLLNEFAESALPVYNSDIISDWSEMPSEFDDSWKEYGTTGQETIVERMTLDLMNYYRHRYQTIYNELAETMPAKENA
jgi:hypothetical protein